MKPTLTWWGDFETKRFQRRVSKRRAQPSVKVTTVRLNGSFLLLCQNLSQCCLDKTKKTFSSKSDPCRCSVGSKILPLCCVKTASEVSEEEGICASRFLQYVFLKRSRGYARFNWHSFAQLSPWCHCQMSLTRRQRPFIQKYFHSILSLTWTLVLHLFCSVRKGNKQHIPVHTQPHRVSHPDTFLHCWIGMGAIILTPNFLEQSL